MLRTLVLSFFLLAIAIGASRAADEFSWRVPILVYHRFDTAASSLTTIRPALFAEQLKWLRSHNIAVVPLHSVIDRLIRNAPPTEMRVVVLTADDGHRSVYTEMYPLLRQYSVHATLFIYPSAISNAKDALTWEQMDEMIKSGFVDVQSHTYWHPNFQFEKRRLTPEAYENFIASQLTRSKSSLETHLGIGVDLLAWPFGLHDSDLERDAAEAGYIAAFTIERKPVRSGDDLYALPRFLMTNLDRGGRFAAIITDAMAGNVPQ